MLPDSLAGSYARYKQYTDRFTTWLGEEAVASGYKPTRVPQASLAKSSEKSTPRLKGKARKEARKAVEQSSTQDKKSKNGVPIKELLAQARVIARSNIYVQVPADITQAIYRAVNVRKRCAEWYQRFQPQKQESNSRHTYFVGTLLEIVEILGISRDVDDVSPSTDAKDPQNIPTITNMFEVLQVEGV